MVEHPDHEKSSNRRHAFGGAARMVVYTGLAIALGVSLYFHPKIQDIYESVFPHPIVGTWAEDPKHMTITFDANHSVIVNAPRVEHGERVLTEGTWRIERGYLLLNLSGLPVKLKLVQLTDSTLIWSDDDGSSKETLLRVIPER